MPENRKFFPVKKNANKTKIRGKIKKVKNRKMQQKMQKKCISIICLLSLPLVAGPNCVRIQTSAHPWAPICSTVRVQQSRHPNESKLRP